MTKFQSWDLLDRPDSLPAVRSQKGVESGDETTALGEETFTALTVSECCLALDVRRFITCNEEPTPSSFKLFR